jgi:NAD(P)-dependent dehydrogenase (short-subunit alcohol dehydrogenase family)
VITAPDSPATRRLPWHALFDLSGQVALVTGSTKGIGEAIARTLAEAGAHVVISSRKQEDCERVAAALREGGLRAEGRACHIGRMEDIQAMAQHLREQHGRLDILVNNAVLSPLRAIEETEPGLFAKTVDVDLRGYWYLSVEAVRLMKAAGGGSIVNISSISALHPERNLGLYSMLKTALLGMSRAFALEYGAAGIRVNSVLPGVIQTELVSNFDAATRQQKIERTPMGRLGEPRDIAAAVLYLTSAASSFVTGASLVVDGGMSIATF